MPQSPLVFPAYNLTRSPPSAEHFRANYSKEPKSVTTFDLFTFFRTGVIQSEASWKLSSTYDWLMPAWKDVS